MSEPALEAALRRDRTIVLSAIVVISALAWAYILWLANAMDGTVPQSMGDMDMSDDAGANAGAGAMAMPMLRPWGPADFGFALGMWAVMMVGMMTPSAAPMILLYARVGRQAASQGRPFAAAGWFAAGYLVVWTGFALIATLAQWALEQLALLDPMMASASPVFGGAVLIMTGAYQWTPLKRACLAQCQAPFSFIQRHGGFRAGKSDSFRLGASHGIYCAGCCWALMALLFVGGVMNVLWIAAISILVLAEKILPAGRIIPRISGAALLIAGIWLVASGVA